MQLSQTGSVARPLFWGSVRQAAFWRKVAYLKVLAIYAQFEFLVSVCVRKPSVYIRFFKLKRLK